VLPIGVQVCTVEVVQDQRCALPSFGASRGVRDSFVSGCAHRHARLQASEQVPL